jgi:predicted permease
VLEDLRFGLKLFRKEKAFTLAALLTLALCIGANTGIFTVLNAVILEPLPFPQPGRLVALYNIYPGMGITDRGANSVPDYLDRRKMGDVFDSIALAGSSGYDAGADGSPLRIPGEYVTPSYFQVLRASPVLGRVFTESEATPGNETCAILSYGLWKEMLGRDPHVLGRDIRLSGVPYRIVGVMPEGFTAPDRASRLWVPFAFTPMQSSDNARHNNRWGMIARLKPGVTVNYAQQRIDALNASLMEEFPKYRKMLEDSRFRTKVVRLSDELTGSVQHMLYLLQAAVGLVLLIGCVNVANLMLVRLNVRMKELAIRFSLGADRWRLCRQLLTESVALSGLGGILGVLTGFAAIRPISWLGASELPRGSHIHMDARVLAFTAVVALLTGLAFGILPVFHLMRRDLNAVFRQSERTGTTERRSLATRSALVVSQVSLAFVLLIGAGLLTLSFSRILAVDPGFKPQRLLTGQFSLPPARYKSSIQARSFVGRLLEDVRAIPGVVQAGASTALPFSGGNDGIVIVVDGYTPGPGENPPAPGWNTVDSGFFRAMGIPLLRGRTFVEADTAESGNVAIIDQFLARKYWPDRDPIGAKIWRGPNSRTACTIVGVVGSVKTADLAEQHSIGQVYFHYKQFAPRAMYLIVKSDRDDSHLASALGRQILLDDPEMPLFDVRTMPQRVAASMLNRRAALTVWLVFAGLALILSAVGIYGVLAYTVAQRTREFGIRVALGAGVQDVLAIVVCHGVKLAGLGLAFGAAAAYALTQAMTALLFEVKPTEPRVYLLVAAVLMFVALMASLFPSIRAVRVRPAVAMRHE